MPADGTHVTIAPGFQTNIRKLAVPPSIAARLARGEDVSPEEIEAARKAYDEIPKTSLSGRRVVEERDDRGVGGVVKTEEESGSGNEWLEGTAAGKAGKRKGKGKGKK